MSILRKAFTELLAIYKKLAEEPKRTAPLLEVIERLHGIRPNLRFVVKDEQPDSEIPPF
jgi:hypothetical protein